MATVPSWCHWLSCSCMAPAVQDDTDDQTPNPVLDSCGASSTEHEGARGPRDVAAWKAALTSGHLVIALPPLSDICPSAEDGTPCHSSALRPLAVNAGVDAQQLDAPAVTTVIGPNPSRTITALPPLADELADTAGGCQCEHGIQPLTESNLSQHNAAQLQVVPAAVAAPPSVGGTVADLLGLGPKPPASRIRLPPMSDSFKLVHSAV